MKTTTEYVRQAIAFRDEIQQGMPEDWFVTLHIIDANYESVVIRVQRWDPEYGRQLDTTWRGLDDPGYLRDMASRIIKGAWAKQQEIDAGEK